jgi:hypothetical protein
MSVNGIQRLMMEYFVMTVCGVPRMTNAFQGFAWGEQGGARMRLIALMTAAMRGTTSV